MFMQKSQDNVNTSVSWKKKDHETGITASLLLTLVFLLSEYIENLRRIVSFRSLFLSFTPFVLFFYHKNYSLVRTF